MAAQRMAWSNGSKLMQPHQQQLMAVPLTFMALPLTAYLPITKHI
jgi:hypothetical protein